MFAYTQVAHREPPSAMLVGKSFRYQSCNNRAAATDKEHEINEFKIKEKKRKKKRHVQARVTVLRRLERRDSWLGRTLAT